MRCLKAVASVDAADRSSCSAFSRWRCIAASAAAAASAASARIAIAISSRAALAAAAAAVAASSRAALICSAWDCRCRTSSASWFACMQAADRGERHGIGKGRVSGVGRVGSAGKGKRRAGRPRGSGLE